MFFYIPIWFADNDPLRSKLAIILMIILLPILGLLIAGCVLITKAGQSCQSRNNYVENYNIWALTASMLFIYCFLWTFSALFALSLRGLVFSNKIMWALLYLMICLGPVVRHIQIIPIGMVLNSSNEDCNTSIR